MTKHQPCQGTPSAAGVFAALPLALVIACGGPGQVTGAGSAQPKSHSLSVVVSGSGTVRSSPPGIDCGTVCSAAFAEGSRVTLTATAASGASFSGWAGACSGTGACALDMNGDATVPEISAASILAKTARDAEMLRLHACYPQYELAQHKGYPTPRHLAALERHGVCEIYRKSFAPVRRVLARCAGGQ